LVLWRTVTGCCGADSSILGGNTLKELLEDLIVAFVQFVYCVNRSK
jgi:hypothetical protein